MNSSKKDISRRCQPKTGQHKTDTSTWWEASLDDSRPAGGCVCVCDELMILCLLSSSTIWCYTVCLNWDWWDRSSASERGLTSLAWRSDHCSVLLSFFICWFNGCKVNVLLFLGLRCRRMWSRTSLTRSPSLASSGHWSCRPGKGVQPTRSSNTHPVTHPPTELFTMLWVFYLLHRTAEEKEDWIQARITHTWSLMYCVYTSPVVLLYQRMELAKISSTHSFTVFANYIL